MADILADALKPYLASGLIQGNTEFDRYAAQWDKGQFDPASSLALMKTYNKAYNLGLTDEQIANGIRQFGAGHQQKFGGGLTVDSNAVAVAAESLMNAMTSAGKDPSQFWSKVQPDLSLGAKQAEARGQAAIQDSMTAQRADMDFGQNDFADFMIDTGAPMLMAAIGAGFVPASRRWFKRQLFRMAAQS